IDFLATGLSGGVGLYTTCGCGMAVPAWPPMAMPIGVDGVGYAGGALGPILLGAAPGSRLRVHPGHIWSATRDIASSNSAPLWKRSSGRLEIDFRITASSSRFSPGLKTEGGLGGACTCLAIRVNGPSASLAVNGGWPT